MLDFAYAMAAPPDGAESGGGSLLALFPPMIMMFLIFYFVLIRPQKKKQDEQRNMLDGLKEGDNVVTMSGFHGTIKKIKDDIVHLQIAEAAKLDGLDTRWGGDWSGFKDLPHHEILTGMSFYEKRVSYLEDGSVMDLV